MNDTALRVLLALAAMATPVVVAALWYWGNRDLRTRMDHMDGLLALLNLRIGLPPNTTVKEAIDGVGSTRITPMEKQVDRLTGIVESNSGLLQESRQDRTALHDRVGRLEAAVESFEKTQQEDTERIIAAVGDVRERVVRLETILNERGRK